METTTTAKHAWPIRPLGEIIDLFDQLRVPLNSRERQERQGIYPYYGAQGVIDHIDAYRFDGRYILVAEDGENLNSKKLPLALFATGKFWVNNHAHVLRGKTGVADDTFLLACLNNADVKPYVTGAAQPKLSQSNLRQIEISLPPLPVQRRIAGVVSAYDNLMENCQRRIRILEEMARALFREWFVFLRFPGHEKVPRVDSSLGQIPKGWAVKGLGEIANITMGLSPKVDTYNEEGDGTPLINGPVEFGERVTKQVKWTTSPTKLCKRGDLVVCVRGSTTGKYVKSDGVYCLGRGVCALSSKHQCFVDLLFVNELPAFLGQTSGSTFPSWTGPQLQSHPVLSPPPELLTRFEEIVQPMSAAALGHSKKIENLRRTRDLLLPRLLSGQVSLDVSAVEDVAEPTAPAPPGLSGTAPPQMEKGSARAPRAVFGAPAEDSSPTRAASPSRETAASPGGNDVPGEAPETAREARALPIDRTAVLQVIRQVFSEGPPRERDAAIRDVARALGYRRTGARIHEILHTDLLTAVRRGILENTGGALRLLARSITDFDRDFLKQQFLAAIGRPWIDRDTATRDFCRWLGFARTGPVIEDTALSLINGLLREGRLEADGGDLVRRV